MTPLILSLVSVTLAATTIRLAFVVNERLRQQVAKLKQEKLTTHKKLSHREPGAVKACKRFSTTYDEETDLFSLRADGEAFYTTYDIINVLDATDDKVILASGDRSTNWNGGWRRKEVSIPDHLRISNNALESVA